MERLIRNKLFGAGLVSVDTELLAGRYNECLSDLGITPTALSSFHIDGIGWSPEIAREKQDLYYLSAGVSNPMGIIITPNQRHRPIYFQFHSYDRTLLEAYFFRFKNQIADATSSRGIALDLDHELTTYESPADLRLVTSIVVRSFTGPLGEAAKKQRAIVKRLTEDERAWRDAALREELSLSAKMHGDLRRRAVDIPDFRFDDVGTFYSRAFGGSFVIQTLDKKQRLLLLEDETQLPKQNALQQDIVLVRDPGTFALLFREKLIELNMEWYQAYPQVLAYIKDCIAAEILCGADAGLRYSELNPVQKKKRIADLGDEGTQVYHELERVMKQMRTTAVPSVRDLSPELRLILVRPNRSLSLPNQQVLRQYLQRLTQVDIIQMYADDKDHFFTCYNRWPESKKAWAVDKICQDYIIETPSEERRV